MADFSVLVMRFGINPLNVVFAESGTYLGLLRYIIHHFISSNLRKPCETLIQTKSFIKP